MTFEGVFEKLLRLSLCYGPSSAPPKGSVATQTGPHRGERGFGAGGKHRGLKKQKTRQLAIEVQWVETEKERSECNAGLRLYQPQRQTRQLLKTSSPEDRGVEHFMR